MNNRNIHTITLISFILEGVVYSIELTISIGFPAIMSVSQSAFDRRDLLSPEEGVAWFSGVTFPHMFMEVVGIQ